MIEIKFLKSANKAVAYDDKKKIGECEFIVLNNIWNIIHTEVNEEYQDKKIARKLVEMIIEEAEKNNKQLIAECSYAKRIINKNNKLKESDKNMNLTINIYYTGKNGSAKEFVKEMIATGIVEQIRQEKGNKRYEYFFPENDSETVLLIDCWENQEALDLHHKSPMMEQIAYLRDKYNLKMKVEQYKTISKDNQDFETVIRKRTATRKFKDKKVEIEKINKILEAGRLAPTAKNLQPQKIYVANSNEALEKIDKVSPCRYGALTVLIVCSDKNIAWTKDNYSTYEMDACIVATHMMLEATNIGVDNIWIEMFDKQELKKQFNLADNIEPICLIPIGYKADDYQGNPLHNERKALDDIVKFI